MIERKNTTLQGPRALADCSPWAVGWGSMSQVIGGGKAALASPKPPAEPFINAYGVWYDQSKEDKPLSWGSTIAQGLLRIQENMCLAQLQAGSARWSSNHQQ